MDEILTLEELQRADELAGQGEQFSPEEMSIIERSLAHYDSQQQPQQTDQSSFIGDAATSVQDNINGVGQMFSDPVGSTSALLNSLGTDDGMRALVQTGGSVLGGLGGSALGPFGAAAGVMGGGTAAEALGESVGLLEPTSLGSKAGNLAFDVGTVGLGAKIGAPAKILGAGMGVANKALRVAKKTKASQKALYHHQRAQKSTNLHKKSLLEKAQGVVNTVGNAPMYAGMAVATVPTQITTEMVVQDIELWAEQIYAQAAVPGPEQDPAESAAIASQMAQEFMQVMRTGHDKERRQMIARMQKWGYLPPNYIQGEVDGYIELPEDRQQFIRNLEVDQQNGLITKEEFNAQRRAMSDPANGKIIAKEDLGLNFDPSTLLGDQ